MDSISDGQTALARCAVESVANYSCNVNKKGGSFVISGFNCPRTAARTEKPTFQLKRDPFTAYTQDSPDFISGEEKVDNAALSQGFIPPSLR